MLKNVHGHADRVRGKGKRSTAEIHWGREGEKGKMKAINL